MMHNPYVPYYLAQQQGHGMPVFRGSLWQMGHGQMGYGLGNLFRSLAKVVTPLVKRGAKTLGKIVATAGADLLGDVAAGKNVKEAVKARGLEALNAAKTKALEQSGSGRRSRGGKRPRSRSKSTKRSRSRKRSKSTKRSRSKKRVVKKRKPSRSTTRSRPAKKRKTSPQDIFG